MAHLHRWQVCHYFCAMNEKEKRRLWAAEQIEHHQARIAELRRFLRLLDASDEAVAGANGTARRGRPAKQGKALADVIAEVLVEAGPHGMSVGEVAAAVTKAGYEPRGQTKVGTAVASELYRQAQRRQRGIVRIGDGRYR